MSSGPWKISESERFWAKVNKSGPVKVAELGCCWEWTAKKHDKGYGIFTTGRRPKRTQWLAHRYRWVMEHGELAEGECVLHSCDNPSCVRHLFKGTQQDNLADMRSKGHQARGIQLSDLSDKDVREIRKRCKRGELQRDVAKRFGIGQTNVSNIVLFKSWKHVM